MKLVEEFDFQKVAFGEMKEKQISPFSLLICTKAGQGKTSAMEFIGIDRALENGFKVIIVGDVKNLRELLYGIYPPELMGEIQRKRLRHERQTPKTIKFRHLHPFTFNLPDGKSE